MKRNLFLAIFLAAVLAGVLSAATNYINDGDTVNLTWSTTSPSSGDPVVKSQAKATGGIVGVALGGSGTASENVVCATRGVFDLSVTASSTVGDLAVGDFVYTTVTASEVCTVSLSNINTGLLFGQCLEHVTASSTAGVYETVKILIRQPGHL
jgi:predicted RecA/RadA family phage recombinase